MEAEIETQSTTNSSVIYSDDEYEDDTIEPNQDLLYEPNQFNIPSTNNSQVKYKESTSTNDPSNKSQYDTYDAIPDKDETSNNDNQNHNINEIYNMANHELREDEILELNDTFHIEPDKNNTIEENKESDENIANSTDNVETMDKMPNTNQKDVRSRQPNRNYCNFYQYYGQKDGDKQQEYTPGEAYVLMNVI